MSASGGPAADNNELRDENRLAWAISAAINAWESGGPRTISEHIAVAIWPSVVAFGDARYQEGRNDGELTEDEKAQIVAKVQASHEAMVAAAVGKQSADLLHRLNAICDLVTVWRDATPGWQFGRRGELRQILDLARGEG